MFQRRHRNCPFQQPSTSCLFCPVRTWHDGQRRGRALAADRTEMKRWKVKHDNCTMRPHMPGTSTRDKQKRRTLPCGSILTILEVMSNAWRPWPVKDIKIKTFTIVGFTCHDKPIPNRKGMELNTKERCEMQVGTQKFALTSYDYERVCLLVFLLLTFCNNSLDTVQQWLQMSYQHFLHLKNNFKWPS